jgi:hypothetical protein
MMAWLGKLCAMGIQFFQLERFLDMHAMSHPHRFVHYFTHPCELTDMTAGLINCVAAIVIIFAAGTGMFTSEDAISAAMWSVLPIAGALLASTMAFLFNRVSESRNAVAGRVIGAVVVGVVVPRALTYFHPIIQTISLDPILLLGIGFAFGMLGYAGGAAIVAKYFKEAPGVVNRNIDRLAEAVSQKVVKKTAENIENHPEAVAPVVEVLAESTAQKVVDKTAANAP